MQKYFLILIPILALQMGCGQGIQSKLGSELTQDSLSIVVDTEDIDQKVVETEAALKDADDEMTGLNPSEIVLDPSSLLNSGSFKKFIDKVRGLIAKIDELQAKIDAQLGLLDPVLNADLIAKLEKVKERLARIESDIEKAKDRLVAKVDAVIVKVEAAINKLNPVLRLLLDSKIEKLMNHLYDFRDELDGLI